MFECLRKRLRNWLLKGSNMVSKEDFQAAVDRITAAQGDTRTQLVAVRETIVALREQLANGGTISEQDLTDLLNQFNERADVSEQLASEVGAADD